MITGFTFSLKPKKQPKDVTPKTKPKPKSKNTGDSEIEALLKDMLGDDPQTDIKYVVLADGSVYFFRKEGDRYAICEQTPPLQKGI